MVLFPLALALLGWNERNYVCTNKSIEYLRQQATEATCDGAIQEDGIIFYSCPVTSSSLMSFNLTAPSKAPSNGNNSDNSNNSDISDNTKSFKASQASRELEVFGCVET